MISSSVRGSFLVLVALSWSACASVGAGEPTERGGGRSALGARGERAEVARPPLADITIPALPDWTDRYAGSGGNGDPRYFEISALMARYELTRWQAVELQNHYRDLSRAEAPGGPEGTDQTARQSAAADVTGLGPRELVRGQGGQASGAEGVLPYVEAPRAQNDAEIARNDRSRPEAWFAEALRRVRAGDYESGYDAERLAAAPFIVVFDLDDTLYDQRVKAPEGCHDLVSEQPGGERRRIKLVPGWAEAFAKIHALGGAIVIFSANLDDPTRANLRAWTWEGVPLLERPEIAAVMTNSYLIMQSKREGPGAENPRHGHPVVLASKDLRLFDEALERVIIVDNNPLRIFHHANTRRFPEFRADRYCHAGGALRAAYEAALPAVVGELEGSLAWQRAHGGTFAEAYRPFTLLGRDVVLALREGGLSEADAVTYIREHPEVVRGHY